MNKLLQVVLTIFLSIFAVQVKPAEIPQRIKTLDAEFNKELKCLAKNVYFEARGEPFAGKVAVAQVSLNRTNSGRYPDTICEVVSQKAKVADKTVCQFSWYCTNKRFSNVSAMDYKKSYNAAWQVLVDGYRLRPLKNALYYHSTSVNPQWRLTKVAKIGNHIFYKEKPQKG